MTVSSVPHGVNHAYGYHHRTLCGIEHPDVIESPWTWSPTFATSCAECSATAVVIDARWPEDRRGYDDRESTPSFIPKQAGRRRGDLSEDQLGHPGLRLPEERGAITRVLRHKRAATAGDEAGRLTGVWRGTGLGPYRSCRSTYEDYALDSVPALDEAGFVGDYAWRGGLGQVLEYRVEVVDALSAKLAGVGLSLPADFVALMTRANLYRALDRASCTCCVTYLSEPLKSPIEPGAWMIRFLLDHQQCAAWHLYLRPDGDSFVVQCDRDISQDPEVMFGPDGNPVEAGTEIFWCAPSVESFAYRFWIEHTLWFAIHDALRSRDLPSEQRAYLSHYL